MIKVLIICNDTLIAKSLVNHVISKNSDLRLIGIGNTLKEGVYLLEKYEPTLIFTTSQKFVRYLNEYFTSYTPGVILIAKPIPNRPVTYRFRRLLMHIHYTDDFKIISEQTFRFVADNYSTSKKRFIKKILTDIGFDFKLTGTIFLQDSLLYISTYKGAQHYTNLKAEIYPFIARKNSTTPQVVKWAITRSINYLYNKSDAETLEKIEKYFDIKYPKKMTPKIIINSIINMFEE